MEYRTADVYIRNTYAGILQETEEGYAFTYDRDYLKSDHPSPVSLTLPLREEAYVSGILFPFFDGLIPEGWLLQVVVNNWKVDDKDRFSLLLLACKDCIGNVSIREGRL